MDHRNDCCFSPRVVLMLRPIAIWLAVALAAACVPPAGLSGPAMAVGAQSDRPAGSSPARVMTGAAVLAERGFAHLDGLDIGLIANASTVLGGEHLLKAMRRANGFSVAAIFSPEHGFEGKYAAGQTFGHTRQDRTDIPIYSLYGQTTKPTQAMLAGLDALVFDIQDIGARFYTYISTMGLAMQAAAEKGIPFIVLDRPNPLGGVYMSGFAMEPAHKSMVGLYSIPVVHGMTVGELAHMIAGERLLDGLDELELVVIGMRGWTRTMRWPDTGLAWVKPSPNIPDFETALVYPGIALFEATTISEGRGTTSPFLLFGAPWLDGPALSRTLNALELPGVAFHPEAYTPRPIPGVAPDPKHRGARVSGVRLQITDYETYLPFEVGLNVFREVYREARRKRARFLSRPRWLAMLSGTRRLQRMLRSGATADEIAVAWRDDIRAFSRARENYLLYGPQ